MQVERDIACKQNEAKNQSETPAIAVGLIRNPKPNTQIFRKSVIHASAVALDDLDSCQAVFRSCCCILFVLYPWSITSPARKWRLRQLRILPIDYWNERSLRNTASEGATAQVAGEKRLRARSNSDTRAWSRTYSLTCVNLTAPTLRKICISRKDANAVFFGRQRITWVGLEPPTHTEVTSPGALCVAQLCGKT